MAADPSNLPQQVEPALDDSLHRRRAKPVAEDDPDFASWPRHRSAQRESGADAQRAADRGGHVERCRQVVEIFAAQFLGQFDDAIVRGAAKDRIVGQPVQLGKNRVFDRLTGITKVDVPQPANPSPRIPTHVVAATKFLIEKSLARQTRSR